MLHALVWSFRDGGSSGDDFSREGDEVSHNRVNAETSNDRLREGVCYREEDFIYAQNHVGGDQLRESAGMREEDRVVEQNWLRVGSRIGNEEDEVWSRSIHQDARIEVREEQSVREEDAVPVKPEFREEGIPEEACRRVEAVLFRDGASYDLLDTLVLTCVPTK